GEACPRPDEGRDAPPCAKIQKDVHQSHEFGLARGIHVSIEGTRYAREGIEEAVHGMKIGFAAVLQGGVDAQPVVPLVAKAAAAERRGIEPAPIDMAELRRHELDRMSYLAEKFVAGSDEPAQVPPAGYGNDGRLIDGWRQGRRRHQIGGKRSCAEQGSRASEA